jgi:exopolysaccharide biosynthesis polyprenyl glycosylphosphotransferase
MTRGKAVQGRRRPPSYRCCRIGVVVTMPGCGGIVTAAELKTAARWVWERRYVRRLLWADVASAAIAATAAHLVRFGPAFEGYRFPYAMLSVVMPAVWVAVVALLRGYEPRLLFVGADEYQLLLRAGVGLIAGVAVFSYSLDARISRMYLFTVVVLCTVITLATRFIARKRLHRSRRDGAFMRRVLVLGHASAVGDLTSQLHRQYFHGLQVVGACLPAYQVDPADELLVGAPVLGAFDQAATAVRIAQADTVIVLACHELDAIALRRLAWALEPGDIDLIVASSLLDVAGYRVMVRPVDGLPMLHVEHPRLTGARRVIKDIVDVTLAGVLLALLAPILALLAVLVRAGSPGPALFRQVRVGKDGRQFQIVKFRTMVIDAEQRLSDIRAGGDATGVLFKMKDDPRISRIGRFLRRYSLDELPQLVNVLRGHMSLVGPRPPLPSEVDAYPSDMRRRLAVKPGLTGLWQVSGRADLPWEEAVRLDLRYVENWSLSLDLVILMRTVSAVLRGAGAY